MKTSQANLADQSCGSGAACGCATAPETEIPDQGEALSLAVLVIQPSPFCNLDCDYCYLPNRTDTRRMEMPVLEKVMSRVFESGLAGPHPFSLLWHAGEPLAVPLKWYREAFAVIDSFPGGRQMAMHNFQTNGTLLNDEWCDFIKERGIEVGLSLDGPDFIHDAHRKTRKGQGTHAKVMKGLETLRRNEINFGVVAVVSEESLDHPDAIYEFFRDNGIDGLGFNIEEVEGINESSSLDSLENEDRVRGFLRQVYLRNKADGNPIRIREFETAWENILQPRLNQSPDGRYLNAEVEPLGMINVDCFGNFSSFSPELLGQATEKYGSFTFGNLIKDRIFDATANEAFQQVLADIESGNRKCAESCEFYQYCGGASPSNKYYENGTFDSSETRHCRSMVQMPLEIVLEDLEDDLQLTN